MKYTIKQKGTQGKPYWVVVNENDRVANGFKHPTEKSAEIHCRNLNAFCGGNKS